MHTCTSTTSGYTTYKSKADCVAACSYFPTDAALSAISSDSFQCRAYHLAAAAESTATAAAWHCPHASEHGGGVCGSGCDVYCSKMAKNCEAGGSFSYADNAACLAECAYYPAPAEAYVAGTSVNSLQCRDYHAGLAGTMSASVHCPHASPQGGTASSAACGSACENYVSQSRCSSTFISRLVFTPRLHAIITGTLPSALSLHSAPHDRFGARPSPSAVRQGGVELHGHLRDLR
jgi:hypothetical protein